MKESFPDLIIALDLTGRFLIDQYTDPKTKCKYLCMFIYL